MKKIANKTYLRCLIVALILTCILLYAATDLLFDEIHGKIAGSKEISQQDLLEKTLTNNPKSDNPMTIQQMDDQTQSKEDNFIKEVTNNGKEETDIYVMPSGMPIGIYVKTKGVMVVDAGEVIKEDGSKVKPCENILKQGDYILSINGNVLKDKNDLIQYVDESNGNPLDLEVERDNKSFLVQVTPVKNKNGVYMLGLWVKDDISGIGTLTFITDEGFGALGHSINDNDTGKMFEISDGAIYKPICIQVVKPGNSEPGRLEGIIDYSGKNIIGRVWNNNSYGILGLLTEKGQNKTDTTEKMKVAKKEEVHTGTAYLLSGVSGEINQYEIEIVSVNKDGDCGNKGIELKIVDADLLNLTGGIVQGMSGTPIVQDGKIVGAVTHVFVKDPRRGYGAFVEDMLKQNE